MRVSKLLMNYGLKYMLIGKINGNPFHNMSMTKIFLNSRDVDPDPVESAFI